jgi:hypothetical protein
VISSPAGAHRGTPAASARIARRSLTIYTKNSRKPSRAAAPVGASGAQAADRRVSAAPIAFALTGGLLTAPCRALCRKYPPRVGEKRRARLQNFCPIENLGTKKPVP